MAHIDIDKVRAEIKKQRLTILLLAVAAVLMAATGQPLGMVPSMVDWKTIATLSGLLLLTTGIEESVVIHVLAVRLVHRLHNERTMALFLVFLAAFLSTFVTNDVALFIVVPLTVSLQRIVQRHGARLVVFEAIAVNVGSSLTPIGNPQNIFLWHHWGISFPAFVGTMLPLTAIMTGWLFLMTMLSFPARKIHIDPNHTGQVDRRLFVVSTLLLVAFVISVDMGHAIAFLPVLLLAVLATRWRVFTKCDWGLILLFIAVFLDVALVCRIGLVRDLLARPDLGNAMVLFVSGALLSQVISNVPSTILLAKYSANFHVIAYAVNVAGNGLVIASFANLIALRLIDEEHKYRTFHLFSLLFFAATAVSTFLLLL